MPDNASPIPESLLAGESTSGEISTSESGDHMSLRLWLRMLNCKDLVSNTLSRRFRCNFSTTGPRFLVLAELDRHPNGLKMNELSQRMLVTGGNITALADLLEAEGLIRREPVPDDRRAIRLKLTEEGKQRFDVMARTHEGWVVSLFDGMSHAEQATLYTLLGRLKARVVQNIEAGEQP